MSGDAPEDPPHAGERTPRPGGSVHAGVPAAPECRRRVVHGPVTVYVSDERAGAAAGVHPPAALDLDRWGRLAAITACEEGVRRRAEMGLRFVDEAEIAGLAGTWLDSPRPTDVLAFPVEAPSRRARRCAGGSGPPLLIGDVVVCPSVAARRAAGAGRPPADELALLVVHGVLHLMGHDHAGHLEARRMARRTRTLLGRHGRA